MHNTNSGLTDADVDWDDDYRPGADPWSRIEWALVIAVGLWFGAVRYLGAR